MKHVVIFLFVVLMGIARADAQWSDPANPTGLPPQVLHPPAAPKPKPAKPKADKEPADYTGKIEAVRKDADE
jgi:hypothetical protein